MLSLQKSSGTSKPTATPAVPPAATVLTMTLVGGNSAAASVGLDKFASTTNYLGATQATSLTDIPNYGQAEYQDVYAGINLVYYGNQQRLEYNFEVAPGADPNQIALNFQGTESITLDSAGDLVLHTAGGDVVEQAPVVYQTIDGVKQTIAGAYVTQGTNQVGFQLGPYDHSQPLIIDPVVVYSTYLGGSGNDFGNGIAVDSGGDVYVAGKTASPDFPTTSNAFQGTFNGGTTASTPDGFGETSFVTEYNPSGQMLSSTYLGGNNVVANGGTSEVANSATSIAVGKTGVYITGSADISPMEYGGYQLFAPFPTTLVPFPAATVNGGYGAFVVELNSALTDVIYSTYLSAEGDLAEGEGIAVDSAGDAYVTGLEGDGPTAGFVDELNASGGHIASVTIEAGSTDFDFGGHSAVVYPGTWAAGIAVDPNGNIYVAGTTDSSTLGSLASPQATDDAGGMHTFVEKFTPQLQEAYLSEVGGDDPQ